MAAPGHEHEHACSARRRRERRLRSWWRHEQFAIRCAVASAAHRSALRPRHDDAEAQTMDPSQTNHERNIVEQTVDVPVSRDIEVTIHMAPAPAATKKRRRVKGTPTLADAHAASDPVIEHASTSPGGAYAAPVPVIQYMDPVTEYASTSPAAARAAPAPLIELALVIESTSLATTEHDEGSLPHHQLRWRRGTSSHLRREGQRFGVIRVKGRRPKDRAASQILRQPASGDVRKPTMSEGKK